MGCDIHLYTEYKKDGAWVTGDAWRKSRYQEENEPEQLEIPGRFRCYDDRNYNFFAWLAGVRNGTWGEQVSPIAKGRGIPTDSCAEIKAMVAQWDGDGHSHTFLTLAELDAALAAADGILVRFEAVVMGDGPEVEAWLKMPEDARGEPPHGYAQASWSGGIPSPKHKWAQKLTDMIGQPAGKVRGFLWDLKWDENVNPEDVRCVFFFDN